MGQRIGRAVGWVEGQGLESLGDALICNSQRCSGQ